MSFNLNDWVLDDYSHVTSSMANSEHSSMSSYESNMPLFPPVYVNLGKETFEKKIACAALSDSCFDVPRFMRNLVEDISILEERITHMTEDAMKENLEQTLIVLAIHSLVMKIRLQATVKDLECIVDKTYKVEEGPLEADEKSKTAKTKCGGETSSSNVSARWQGRPVSCETENTLHKMTQFPLNYEIASNGLSMNRTMEMNNVDPILSESHSFNECHIKIVNTMGTLGPVIIKVYSDEIIVAERCLSDSEELEFGFDQKSDGSTVFRVYAAWRFDGLVETTAELYSGQGTENYGFWFRGDGLYRGDYENGQNLKLVKKWRP